MPAVLARAPLSSTRYGSVEPEAVHPHLGEPEPADLLRLGAHGRSGVVQVGHLGGEDAVVVLVAHGRLVPDLLPPRAALRGLCRSEAEPRTVGRRGVAQRLLEVRVLARRVVEHEIHQHSNPPAVRRRDQSLEVGVRAILGIHPVVVLDVVSVVAWRRGDRHEPDASCAEASGRARVAVVHVVEFLRQSGEVADAVAVAVEERPHEDLVAHTALPPGRVDGRSRRLRGEGGRSDRRDTQRQCESGA